MSKKVITDLFERLDGPNLIAIMLIAGSCVLYTKNSMNRIEDRIDSRIAAQEKLSNNLLMELSMYRKESDEKLSNYRKESDEKFYALLKEKK